MPRTKRTKITKQEIVQNNILNLLTKNTVMKLADLRNKSAISAAELPITQVRFSKSLKALDKQIVKTKDLGGRDTRRSIVKLRA